MKEKINQTIAILMVFVVLFSTMSFTIDVGFCDDNIVDVSFFKLELCNEGIEKNSSETSCEPDESCCSFKELFIIGYKELQIHSFGKTEIDSTIFLAELSHLFSKYIIVNPILDNSCLDYSTPYLETDFLVSHQIFLI